MAAALRSLPVDHLVRSDATSDSARSRRGAAFVADPGAGGTVLFAGTVRDHSDAGAVTGLEYEAWEERAAPALEDIGGELFERWPSAERRSGTGSGRSRVGEVSVLVCCPRPIAPRPSRRPATGSSASSTDVPIWKKEALVDGEAHWVMGS